MNKNRSSITLVKKRRHKNDEIVLRQAVEEVICYLREKGCQRAADVLAFRFCLEQEGTNGSYRTLHEVADHFEIFHEYIILLEEHEVRPRFTRLLRKQNGS